MPITFPPIEEENHQTESIEFNAELDGKTIQCAMTYDALRAHFDAEYSDPLFAFVQGRPEIEPLAARLISEGRLEADGSLLLTRQDFKNKD